MSEVRWMTGDVFDRMAELPDHSIDLCTAQHIAPDECQNCGGSASLGGAQQPLDTDIGVYCSTECHDEAREAHARWRPVSP